MSTFFFGSVIDISAAIDISANASAGSSDTATYTAASDKYAIVQIHVNSSGISSNAFATIGGMTIVSVSSGGPLAESRVFGVYVGPGQTLTINANAPGVTSANAYATGVEFQNNS